MNTKERRQTPRMSSDLVLEVYNPDGQLVAGVGRLLDLSAQGGRFETVLRLSLGQTVRAHLRLDSEKALEVQARVIWTRAKGPVSLYGVQFVGFTDKEFGRLKTWVTAHGGSWEASPLSNTTFRIGSLPGDGVGPECLREGIKVVQAALGSGGFKIEWMNFDFGGEHYLKTGEILPESALEEFRKLDAIYLVCRLLLEIDV